MAKKQDKAAYFKENDWILFEKENGTVGVTAAGGKEPSGTVLEIFHGSLSDASERAADLENGEYTENSLFDFGLGGKDGE